MKAGKNQGMLRLLAVCCMVSAVLCAMGAERTIVDEKKVEAMGDTTELSRGSYLRTEVRNTETSFEVRPELMISEADRRLVLRLKKYEVTHLTEVRIYETLVRFFVKNEDNTGYFDYRRLPDDLWEGETNIRCIEKDVGIVKNTKVLVDDVACHTDADGLVQADKDYLELLDYFDSFSSRVHDFLIRCDGFPMRSYRLFRTMPQRSVTDEKRLEEPSEQDVLMAYGLDFLPSKNRPEQERLFCTVSLPENFTFAEKGVFFPLRVKVKNNGTAQTSCLIARIFSRVEGLNGKLFYFGAIKPGEEREFVRYVRVSPDVRTGKVYANIHFSDSWGVLKQSLPVSFTVIHGE